MFGWLRDWIKEEREHKRKIEDLMARQAERQELEARRLRGEYTEQEKREFNLASIRTAIQYEISLRRDSRVRELANESPGITAEEIYETLKEERLT